MAPNKGAFGMHKLNYSPIMTYFPSTRKKEFYNYHITENILISAIKTNGHATAIARQSPWPDSCRRSHNLEWPKKCILKPKQL